MRGINRVIIGGNVGNDPDTRFTQGGTAVCNLRVAVNEKEKKGGEYVDVTTWCTVVCFGKTAEFVGEYIKKGARVYVEGRLRQKEWTAKDGTVKKDFEIIADRLDALDKKGESSGGKPEADEDSPF